MLLSSADIAARVRAMGEEISLDYAGQRLKVGIVLAGAWVFGADLVRAIHCQVDVFFLQASSYGESTVRAERVRVGRSADLDLSGADVLVVDDIVDTGHTAVALLEELSPLNPASLRLAALLSKPSRRQVDVKLDYLGFEVPDQFVVGYGLDYGGFYRNLPDLRSLG